MGYFKDTVWEIPREIVFFVVIAVVLVGGTTVIGYIQDMDAILYIPLVLVVLVLSLVAIRLYHEVKREMQKPSVERSDKIIRGWLDRTRVSVANSPSSETHYRYKVTLDSHAVSVYRPKDDPDLVYFGINLLVPEADYDALDSITGAGNSSLLREIRIEVARKGVQYAGIRHPLRTILITHAIVFDHTLTRPAFYEKLLLMIQAQILLGQLIDGAARDAGVSLQMQGASSN